MTKKLCGFAAVFVLLVGATPAQAQFELEPYLGVYIPTQDLIDQEVTPGVQVTGSQKEALAVGARLGYGFGPFGIEGNFLYAFSDAEGTDEAGDPVPDESAAVWTADGRLVWKVLPVGPVGIHLSGGVALIGRSGDAYQDVEEGKTDVGGVLGAGVKIKLPGMFAIRGDLDVFGYEAGIEAADSQFQVDVVASAGLVFQFGVM
ncbi:MAG: outer membrane beta-barrel protein [Gemmatimonadota bacterium]|nr:MAG: outer membrane beta-barrel protein [Gemmatimonadota bacterium]